MECSKNLMDYAKNFNMLKIIFKNSDDDIIIADELVKDHLRENRAAKIIQRAFRNYNLKKF